MTRLHRNILPALLPLLCAQAAGDPPPAPRNVVVSAAALHDGTGASFAPGQVLVEDGIVKEMGRTVKVPAGAERWDLGGVITPWLVDPFVSVDLGRGEAGRPEAALLSAAEARPAHDPWVAELRERGIGAVGLVPSGGAGLSGRAATMGTLALPESGAPLLKAESSLCWWLPEDITGSASRASARQAIAQAIEDADTARRKKQEAKTKAKETPRAGRRVSRDRPGGPSPASSVAEDAPQPAQDVMLQVVDKKLPLFVALQRDADALSVLSLAEQRGMTVVLAGCRGCAGVAREIGRSQAIVVLDPLHAPASERNGLAGDATLAGDLAAAGARVAVTGGGAWPEGPQALRMAAASLAGGGATEEIAIAAMTGRAAEAAGIADRIVIAVGKPARFLAWSGSPLDPRSRLTRRLEADDFKPPASAAP